MSLWVEKAYSMLHPLILKYIKDTQIPFEWVAGLISVECARLDPKAKRFEAHVFKSVLWVKQGNKSTAFPGFNSGRIKAFIQSTDDQAKLKSLATSYGLGQLMGYHYVNKWDLKPEIYMNLSLEDSVKYTVEFMKSGLHFVEFPYREKLGRRYEPFEQLMHWHNTGSVTGTTYHSNYVANATKIANEYKEYANYKETRNG